MTKNPERHQCQTSPLQLESTVFSLQSYFNTKKLNVVNFFKQFNAIVHQTCLQVQLEIDQEYSKAKQIAEGISKHILYQQCMRMRQRENCMFVTIINILCMRVKQHLENRVTNDQNLRKSQSVTKFKQNTNQYLTPPRQQSNNDKYHADRNQRERARSLQSFLAATRNSQNHNNYDKNNRSLSLVQKDQSICKNLDRKIHKEALNFLNNMRKSSHTPQVYQKAVNQYRHLDPQCIRKTETAVHCQTYGICRRQSLMSNAHESINRYPHNEQLQRQINAKISQTPVNRHTTQKKR